MAGSGLWLGNAFDLDNEYRRAELSISRLPSQNIPFSTYSLVGPLGFNRAKRYYSRCP